MKQTYIIAMLALFVSGMLFIPGTSTASVIVDSPVQLLDDSSSLSGQVPREISVAIYDEPNGTLPSYGALGLTSTNITPVVLDLEAAGYSVTPLTFQDILDHELKVADYDVFVLFDNNPRENITELVKQYWLGGGGILSIDGAINYINYFGIMCPDTEGTNDYNSDWYYSWSSQHTIEARHPVTKAFQVGEKIANELDWAAFNRTLLETCSTSTEYTILSSSDANTLWVNTVARDPEFGGGRVVQVLGDAVPDRLPDATIVANAVDWLAMRPKGRILFDLTHQPYYGVEEGDPSTYSLQDRHIEYRDMLVSSKFTFDKAYPSDGPLTLSLLAKYDMLYINAPYIAYTTAEITAIRQWVAAGGGLFLSGEWLSFATQNANIRAIIEGWNMNITTAEYPTGTITVNITVHPTTEVVYSLHMSGGSYVDSWGAAYPLVKTNATEAQMVVAQEVGEGRVILAADINFVANQIDENDNRAFARNIANWLCSSKSNILLYTDGKSSLGADYNFYRSPAAMALNELGLEYFMTNERDMFNECLKMQSWELLVIDSNNFAPYTSFSLIRDHFESGGKVIWRDFLFRFSDPDYEPMWNYMGFAGSDTSITGGPPTVTIWETTHSIFNLPVDYDNTTISSSVNQFSTDFAYVELLGNATGLAGLTPTYNSTQAAIVLGVGGRALCNMFAISEYLDDSDDSTYADGYELFINEIAYMMRPTIDHPVDIEFEEGETGYDIIWTPQSDLPARYRIFINGSEVVDQAWLGGQISYNLDALTNGTYIFEVLVYDNNGYTVWDEVQVHVLIPPSTTTSGGELPIVLIIAAAAGVVIVIVVIIIIQKRPKS